MVSCNVTLQIGLMTVMMFEKIFRLVRIYCVTIGMSQFRYPQASMLVDLSRSTWMKRIVMRYVQLLDVWLYSHLLHT